MTNYNSFKNLQEWYQLVKSIFVENPPTIALMGNKSDLNHLRNVRKDLHTRWSRENNFMSFFVSAKTGDSVRSSFIRIASVLAQVEVKKTTIQGMAVRYECVHLYILLTFIRKLLKLKSLITLLPILRMKNGRERMKSGRKNSKKRKLRKTNVSLGRNLSSN